MSTRWAGPAPTGSVTFYDGATALGAAGLRYPGSGQATLSAGLLHNCALADAGGLKCWGWNSDGQLGDGMTVNRLAPVATINLLALGARAGALLDEDARRRRAYAQGGLSGRRDP